jgi:hypothetical protein
MGKKQIKQGPDLDVPPPLPQKELYQRVNFALQASAYLHSLASVAGSSDRKGKRKATGDVGDDGVGEGYVDMGGLAMGNMKATRKMAAHTQLKLWVYSPFVLSKTSRADSQRPFNQAGRVPWMWNRAHPRTD